MVGKRCVCGRSGTFPLCDGSHREEAWTCQPKATPRAEWGFVAAPANANLAERLAFELGGMVVSSGDHNAEIDDLVVLTDGTDLDGVLATAERVKAGRRRAVGIGIERRVLVSALPDWQVSTVSEAGVGAWDAVRDAVVGPAPPEQTSPLATAFLSHAVADEGMLVEPLGYLRRRYAADLFVCADSIRSGQRWQEQIEEELRARDLFILLVSEASSRSTFCAFETGFAVALKKPVALISLDGSRPPSFVQHLHMIDLDRNRSAKPWMERGPAVVEALLSTLARPQSVNE